MTRIFFGVITALFIGFVAGFTPATATAGTACPPSMQAINACSAWHRAQQLPAYTGKLAQTREPVSCAKMMQREPSALLLYRGRYVRNPDKRGVRVITRFRNVGWKREGGVFTKVICVPKQWMRTVSDFTVCGSVGHYYFNGTEASYFKRQHGRLTSDDIARMWKGG